jgi:outer membrane protein OmpA-like peptidoglycan-associated protein
LSISAGIRYVLICKAVCKIDAKKYKGLGDMIRRRPIKEFSMKTGASLTAIVALAEMVHTVPAEAQQRFLGSNSNVVIDMSVLDGGGGQRALLLGPGGRTGGVTTSSGFVLFPPSKKPLSRLEGSLANRSFALTPPRRAAIAAPARTAAAPAVPAPSTPKPAAATVAKAVPAPATPAPAPQVTAPPPSPAETSVQPATASPPAPTQTAAVTNAAAPASETRILFEQGSPDLTDSAIATLDALAASLKANSGLRIQLQAFASGSDETAPEARRLSLKRALNVRGHLVEREIRNTRMDVRALGIKSAGGPADRVDAVIVTR